MENFSKRTITSLFASLLLLGLACGFALVMMGKPMEPAVQCDGHMHCAPTSKAA